MEKEKQERVPWTPDEIAQANRDLKDLQNRLQKGAGAKGFKKLTAGNLQKMEAKRQKIAQRLGEEYLEWYKSGCELYGIEVRAVMETNPTNPNTAQAVTRLMPYSKPEKPKMQAWSTAMADNLHTRAACQHVIEEEGGVCEKCRLAKAIDIDGVLTPAWGEGDKGVTNAYSQYMKKKIEAEIEKENTEEKE